MFTRLLKSDVALVLIDGQKLLDHAGEEEKYLKSLLWGLRDGLEKLKDDILADGKPLTEFPRIWILALSKADLHPGLNAEGFQDLIVEKAAGDVSALHDTLKTFVQVPEALSLGEDFMLLSSARFKPGKIEVTERVGLDLILPVATMLPLERLAQWAGKFDIPLKVLGGLVDHADALAALLTGTGAAAAAKFLTKIPKVGPILVPIAIPALAEAVKLSKSKLEQVHAQALADRDFLTAVLTQFRLDLDHGVEDHLLVKSLWWTSSGLHADARGAFASSSTGGTPTRSRSTSALSGEPRVIQPRAGTSAAMSRCDSLTSKDAGMPRGARSPTMLSSCRRWRTRSTPSRTVSGLSGRFSPMLSPVCGTCLSRLHQTKSRRLSGPNEATSGRPTLPSVSSDSVGEPVHTNGTSASDDLVMSGEQILDALLRNRPERRLSCHAVRRPALA
jgi:hypothetical protein